MTSRQTERPCRWMIVDEEPSGDVLRKLPSRTGLLVLGNRHALARRLRRRTHTRSLDIIVEGKRQVARVHNMAELRRALVARTQLILLSPIYPTQSHPDCVPLPLMRAAAMARLAGRRLIALGGMNDARFRRIAPLGFQGWAGISGFRT